MDRQISFKTFVHNRANYHYKGPARMDFLTTLTRFVSVASISAPILYSFAAHHNLSFLQERTNAAIVVASYPVVITIFALTFIYGFRAVSLKIAAYTAIPIIGAYVLRDYGLYSEIANAHNAYFAVSLTLWLTAITYISAIADIWRNGAHDSVSKDKWEQVPRSECY